MVQGAGAATKPARWMLFVGVTLLFLSVGAFSAGDAWFGVPMVVVGLILLWRFISRHTAAEDATQPADHADAAAAPNAPADPPPPQPTRAKAGRYSPATPAGRAVSSWARESTYVGVAGESYYDAAFRAIFKRRGLRLTEEGRELVDEAAHLVHDPRNPHDENAIVVWVAGEHVGFLPKDQAAAYAAGLDELADEGAHLCVPARVWARTGYDNRIHASVSLTMPPQSGILPFNQLPDEPHVVLPRAKTVIQVTGEEQHMDVLGAYVADQPRYLAVTLHLVSEAKTARSTPYEAVEVRLDGKRAGCLTKAMSDQLSDLVRHVEERGQVPIAHAVLKGSPLRADMALDVARSADVTSRWLDEIPQAPAREI